MVSAELEANLTLKSEPTPTEINLEPTFIYHKYRNESKPWLKHKN